MINKKDVSYPERLFIRKLANMIACSIVVLSLLIEFMYALNAINCLYKSIPVLIRSNEIIHSILVISDNIFRYISSVDVAKSYSISFAVIMTLIIFVINQTDKKVWGIHLNLLGSVYNKIKVFFLIYFLLLMMLFVGFNFTANMLFIFFNILFLQILIRAMSPTNKYDEAIKLGNKLLEIDLEHYFKTADNLNPSNLYDVFSDCSHQNQEIIITLFKKMLRKMNDIKYYQEQDKVYHVVNTCVNNILDSFSPNEDENVIKVKLLNELVKSILLEFKSTNINITKGDNEAYKVLCDNLKYGICSSILLNVKNIEESNAIWNQLSNYNEVNTAKLYVICALRTNLMYCNGVYNEGNISFMSELFPLMYIEIKSIFIDSIYFNFIKMLCKYNNYFYSITFDQFINDITEISILNCEYCLINLIYTRRYQYVKKDRIN